MKGTLPRLDTRRIVVTSRDDIEEEKAYWLSRTPLERLEAIEISRRMVYGEDAATSRLQRVFEVSKRTRS